MQLVAYFCNTKCFKISEIMTKPLAHGYSFESWDLSNEYLLDRVKTYFKNLCILVLRKKEASALEWLMCMVKYQHGNLFVNHFLMCIMTSWINSCLLGLQEGLLAV